MSLPDWVQLFRNAFSIARTIAPKESAIFKVPYPESSLPLSTIEYGIACTQVPAIYFFFSGSVKSFTSSYSDVRKYRRLLIEVDRFRFEDMNTTDGLGPEIVSSTLRHALQYELDEARRRFKIGWSQLSITLAFLLLSLNTLGYRFPAHPTSVINAVIFMLAGLSYLLYTMVLSIYNKYIIATKARKLKKRLRNSSNGNDLEEILALVYRAGFGNNLMDALIALTSSPEDGSSSLQFQYKKSDLGDYEDAVAEDLETVRDALLNLREDDAASAATTPQRRTRSKARASAGTSTVPAALLRSLDAHIRAQYVSAGLTSAFFALNFAAGYGYLMPVLAFYLPHEAQLPGTAAEAFLKLAMFARPSAVADWWGNMVGDVAWTVEPLLAMAAPAITKFAFKVCARCYVLYLLPIADASPLIYLYTHLLFRPWTSTTTITSPSKNTGGELLTVRVRS